MRYLIHEDGSFDILGSSILLHNAYPSLNGQMLRPVRIEVKKDTVTYQLVQGSVSIRFREEPDGRRYYAGDGMGEQAGARIKKYFAYIKGGLIAQQVRAHA